MDQTNQKAHSYRHSHTQTTVGTMVLHRSTVTLEVASHDQPIHFHTIYEQTPWHRGSLPRQHHILIFSPPPYDEHVSPYHPC